MITKPSEVHTHSQKVEFLVRSLEDKINEFLKEQEIGDTSHEFQIVVTPDQCKRETLEEVLDQLRNRCEQSGWEWENELIQVSELFGIGVKIKLSTQE